MSLLDSIHYVPDFSEYNQNVYKFLKVRARSFLKKNIAKSPSMDKVAQYFEGKGEAYKSAWSYFYAGKVAHLNGDYKNASIYFSEAQDSGGDLQDSLLLFNVYYYMGELYSSQCDKSAGIEAYEKALSYHCSLPIESYLSLKIGDCYLNVGQYEQALAYYSISEKLSIRMRDSVKTSCLLMNISRSYIENNDKANAIQYLRKALAYNDESAFVYRCMLTLAEIYLKENDLQTVFVYLEKLSAVQRVSPELLKEYYRTSSSFHAQKKKYEQAYKDFKNYNMISDSLVSFKANQKIDNIIRYYNKKKLIGRNLILRKQRVLLYMGMGLLFLICLIIILYVRYIIKKKENHYLEACSKIEILKNLNEKSNQFENKFKEILLGKLEVSRRLALISGQPLDKHMSFLKMYDEVMGDFQKIQLDWGELYFSVNFVYDNFQKRLIEYFPVLNEKEIQVCCLLRAGFRTDEISFVMRQSIYTVHKHKTLIRKKLGMDERTDITEWLLISMKELISFE